MLLIHPGGEVCPTTLYYQHMLTIKAVLGQYTTSNIQFICPNIFICIYTYLN